MTSSIDGPSARIQADLGQFRAAADQGEAVLLSLDGQKLRVLASATFEDAGGQSHSVSWVASGADTTGLFIQALGQTYGGRLGQEIASTLGLQPTPGKPLESRLVKQAIDMAATSQGAMDGIDFLTQLAFSAAKGGQAFQRSVAELQLDPRTLDPGKRQWIDEQMADRFNQAQADGQSPISSQTASAWLGEILGKLADA